MFDVPDHHLQYMLVCDPTMAKKKYFCRYFLWYFREKSNKC